MKFEDIPSVIKTIQQETNKFEQYFIEDELEYIDAYCGFVTRQFHAGTFDGDTEDMPWSKYNIRYGIQSVIGFLGEVVAIGVLNQQADVNGTEYRLVPEDKATQTAGVDISVCNSSWVKPFTAQVKVSSHRSMKLHLDKTNAHRLVVVDLSHRLVMMCDLPTFKTLLSESGGEISLAAVRSSYAKGLRLSTYNYTNY